MATAAHPPGEDIPRGIALRLLAVLLLATLSALIKAAEARGVGLVEMMMFRQAVALPVVFGFMLVAGPGLSGLRTRAFGGQAIRAATGVVAMAVTFATVLLLPLAEATTLGFTVPIFGTILSAIVLREAVGRHRWAAVLIGFAGVLIVTRPGVGGFAPLGTACGLASSVMVAFIAIQLRQIGRVDGPVTTVFWFTLLSLIPIGAAYPFFAHPHDAATYALLAAMGVAGGLAQIAFTAALRHAPVSAVLPMDYTSLIWATLYGWALFGALPSPWTWVGAPLIAASGAYTVWRERRLSRAPVILEAVAD